MSFQPNGNLVEQVTDYIAEKIIQNELKPGARIYDTKLAQEMGVSRTPIREAIRILERNRLVELIPRRGVVVTEISESQVEWFYDVFEQLYGLVARKAAENHTRAHLQKIESALRDIETAAAAEDTHRYYDCIFAFADAGLKAAQNPFLEGIIKDMWPSNRRIQYASLRLRKDDLKQNVDFFRRATRFLKQQEGEKAEAVIREFARTEKRFALQLLIKSE